MIDSSRAGARTLRSPVFVISAVVLVAAVTGLRPAMSYLDKRFEKKTVPPRKPFSEFDGSGLATFEKLPGPPPIVISAEDVETDHFFMIRTKEKTGVKQAEEAILFLTYYSDPDDQVPHTPEVCYRQAGAVVEHMETITLDTPGLAPEHPRIPARFLDLSYPDSRRVTIVYTFCVNGEFRHDREEVRWRILMPGDPYIYFSKVEALVQYNDPSELPFQAERARQLLREALPVLVHEYYPDTAFVKGR